MELFAPAKLNLVLQVGPTGPDGYHPLASWFCTVDLGDVLYVRRRERGPRLTCSDPSLPVDEGNLVTRAVRALDSTCALPADFALHLHKVIPAGGGVGGGSSDAAAALRLARLVSGGAVDEAAMSQVAGQIGADVPFFLTGGSAWCLGRGERVTPIAPPQPVAALLMFPPFGVSTAAVYRRFDEMGLGRRELMAAPDARWSGMGAIELLAQLHNDLLAPAMSVEPRLGPLMTATAGRLARAVHMSGSGSTLYTLYDRLDEAVAAAARVQGTGLAALHAVPFLNALPEVTYWSPLDDAK